MFNQPLLKIPRNIIVANRRPRDIRSICNQSHWSRTTCL